MKIKNGQQIDFHLNRIKITYKNTHTHTHTQLSFECVPLENYNKVDRFNFKNWNVEIQSNSPRCFCMKHTRSINVFVIKWHLCFNFLIRLTKHHVWSFLDIHVMILTLAFQWLSKIISVCCFRGEKGNWRLSTTQKDCSWTPQLKVYIRVIWLWGAISREINEYVHCVLCVWCGSDFCFSPVLS